MGTMAAAKLLPLQSEDKIVDVIVLHLKCEGVIIKGKKLANLPKVRCPPLG